MPSSVPVNITSTQLIGLSKLLYQIIPPPLGSGAYEGGIFQMFRILKWVDMTLFVVRPIQIAWGLVHTISFCIWEIFYWAFTLKWLELVIFYAGKMYFLFKLVRISPDIVSCHHYQCTCRSPMCIIWHPKIDKSPYVSV